ncbi:MAG: energy-coupling factor transporter transmembrane component T [Chloroflexota bacterium]
MRQFVWHQVDSPLHRLNPLTKLGLSLGVVAIVSFATTPLAPALVAALAIGTTVAVGRVPLGNVLRPMAFAAVFALGVCWTGVLFYVGPGSGPDAPAVWAGPPRITEAAVTYGITMGARLLAIFATSALFVLTTDPVELVLAMIHQARVPYRVGYAVFAAYRFMPLLQDELGNIRAAHQMRGRTGGGGPVGTLREYAGYAIPLLAIAVRRAERVALAMDARAFGALPRRTYYRQTTVGFGDLMFAAVATAALGAIVLYTT